MDCSNAIEQNEQTNSEHDTYDTKIQAMQKYIPFLNQLIQRLESSENVDQDKVVQMHLFLRILQDATERIEIDELEKCELALSRIYDMHEQNNSRDAMQNTIETMQINKEHIEKKESLNYEINKKTANIVIQVDANTEFGNEVEPETVFVPQANDACNVYEREDDVLQDKNSEANNSDDDDVQVIEIRNSPICLDSEDDDDSIIVENSQNSNESCTIKNTLSSTNRNQKGYARKSTAKKTNMPMQKIIELIESSEDTDTEVINACSTFNTDSSESSTATTRMQNKFLNAINLRPRILKKKPANQIETFKGNNKKRIIRKSASAFKSCYHADEGNEITKIQNQSHRRWLNNFVNKFACYSQRSTSMANTLLQTVLDPSTYTQIYQIRKDMNTTTHNKNYSCITNFELLLKLREIFFNNGDLKPIGLQFCTQHMPHDSVALIIDKKTGHVTSRTHTSEELEMMLNSKLSQSNRKRCKEDENYTPETLIMEEDLSKSSERRRSLRKRTTKLYCESNNEKEDDSEVDIQTDMIQRKAQQAYMAAKKRRTEQVKSFENTFHLSIISTEFTNAEDLKESSAFMQSQNVNSSNGDIDFVIYDNKDQTAESTNVIDLSDDSVSEQMELSVLPSTYPKNNVKGINLSNTKDYCKICQKSHTHVVHHYVNFHRGCEVYHSRFTDSQLEIIERLNSKPNAVSTFSKCGDILYKAICAFCEKNCRFKVNYWYHHFAIHTGEYAYRCSGCGIRKPTRSMLQEHVNQPCSMEGKLLQDYYFDSKATKIDVCLCTICNYVQLHRKNITKHLHEQHNITDFLALNIRSITLLTLPPQSKQNNIILPKAQSNSTTIIKENTFCHSNQSQNYINCMSDEFSFEERVGKWVEDTDPTDDISFMISGRLDVSSIK